MPYFLKTILCLLALPAALVSPFAAAGDAIAEDSAKTTASVMQGMNWRDMPTRRMVIYPDADHGEVSEYHEDSSHPKRCNFWSNESARVLQSDQHPRLATQQITT